MASGWRQPGKGGFGHWPSPLPREWPSPPRQSPARLQHLSCPQLDAKLRRVRVVQFVEDGKGLPPGILGLVLLASGMVGIAEVSEGVGLAVAVAEFAENAQGVAVAVGGVGKVSELVLGVAQAVPRACLAGAV